MDTAAALTWVARVWEMHLWLDQHALGRDGSRAVAVGVDWSLVRHWGRERGQNRGSERESETLQVAMHRNILEYQRVL